MGEQPHVYEFIIQNMVHVAAAFTLVCYLFRNQIWLRIFAVAGDSLLAAYYFAAFPIPLWNPLYWSVLNVVINCIMILAILHDARLHEMSDDEMNLFRCLRGLTPGQFRKLMKQATWLRNDETRALTVEGQPLTSLHYVLEGRATINKQGRMFDVDPELFIGELAFLRSKVATASVTLPANSLIISWPHEALQKLFRQNQELCATMTTLLSRDMAEKVAKRKSRMSW